MTDLEKAIVNALRLSEDAAEQLLTTIQRLETTARAELIRSGVVVELAESDAALVEDAIICYVQAKMSDADESDRYMAMFNYQMDNLRKS